MCLNRMADASKSCSSQHIVAPSGRHRSRVPFAEFWRLELVFPESAEFLKFRLVNWWSGRVGHPAFWICWGRSLWHARVRSELWKYWNLVDIFWIMGDWHSLTTRSGKHVVLRGQKSQQMMRKSAPIRCWKHPAKPGVILSWCDVLPESFNNQGRRKGYLGDLEWKGTNQRESTK